MNKEVSELIKKLISCREVSDKAELQLITYFIDMALLELINRGYDPLQAVGR